MNEDKIIQKLEEHDKRFDAYDKRFDEHDRRFDEQDRRLDMLAKKAIEHDARFDELVTKNEFNDFKDEVLSGQDEMLTILQNLQQEIPAIAHAVTRHDKDISRIKEHLDIA